MFQPPASAPFFPPGPAQGGMFQPPASAPFFPPAPAQGQGEQVHVPGFFVASGQGLSGLVPLAAPAWRPATPADQGIQASEGDDTSAPNATTAERMNRVVCAAVASVGYSSAAKETDVPPSAVDYDAEVVEGPRGFGMTLRIQLTYASAFPEEGMVVWLKKRQQMINDEQLAELLLIETAFEDYVDGKWIPITTDIRYAEEAEAVVQAVITSDSGQTAGRVQTSGAVEDAKLGPVGAQGRIVLTYFCEQLYSYSQMALPGEEQAGSRSLVPLSLQLPWAPCDSPAAQCRVSARVRGPAGCCLLDPGRHVPAYYDLKQSFLSKQMHTAMIVPAPAADSSAAAPAWAFSHQTLPPMSAAVLAWLSVPDALDDGWEEVGNALPAAPAARATLLKPLPEDEALLRVALPGGQAGQLLRCRVETAPAKRSSAVVRVHTDITISDASGSTGMGLQGGFGGVGGNVRSGFNRAEERRVLARLQAMPLLRAQGLLLPDDVWRQHFVVFDNGVKADFELETRVGDLDDATVAGLCRALQGEGEAAAALVQAGKQGLLQAWGGLLEKLRGVTPGGTTSFAAGASRARERYVARGAGGSAALGRQIQRTAYVNFDTDGGNNCGSCYDAIRELVSQADVVQGHVMGVGAWVDQDCASKVAKILKGSASLALSFPEQAAADSLLRQDVSRWIKVLRSCPVTVASSAGAESWVARHGARAENAVECLLAGGADCIRFDEPDVSEDAYTKAQLKGLQAGESAMLYFLSRLPLPVLQQRLRVELRGAEDSAAAAVAVAAEPLRGVALGHHWLAALGGGAGGLVTNGSSCCTRLRQRLEDDLSFAWNLPSKSGSTAALGRARTQRRPPVPAGQQPEEPSLPEPELPASWGGPFGGGLFGGGPQMGGAAFGGQPRGASTAAEAAPRFRCLAASRGPPPPPGGGPPAAPARAAAPAGKGPAPGKGMGKGPPPPGGRGMLKGKQMWSPEEAPAAGPAALAPGRLLELSKNMRVGPRDSPEADIKRAVAALRYLAQCAQGGPAPARPEAEDPLVAAVFGQAPVKMEGQQETVHHGFVCDACQSNPMVGARFKASSKADVDVCGACRVQGRLAGGGGFRALAGAAVALGLALEALLEWWPLAWAAAGASPPALPLREGALGAAADVRGLAPAALCEFVRLLPEV